MANFRESIEMATANPPIPEKFLIKKIFDQAADGFIFEELFVIISAKVSRKGSILAVEGTDAGGDKFIIEVIFPDAIKVTKIVSSILYCFVLA